MTLFQILDLVIKAMVPLILIYLTFLAHNWRTRKDKMELIEKSFVEMQRFNEFILSDSDNLKAGVLAATPEEFNNYDEFKSRVSYVHLMRINRIYRVWYYHNKGFISKTVRDEIIVAHSPTLKNIAASELSALMQRGYPDDFSSDLKGFIDKAEQAKPLY